MCLQSAKQKHLRAQQQPLRSHVNGLPIFKDVSNHVLSNHVFALIVSDSSARAYQEIEIIYLPRNGVYSFRLQASIFRKKVAKYL